MDIIGYSIKKPVSIIVGVILLILFGLLALSKLPYQLTPTVTQPELSVKTFWPGATPYEVESNIIQEQEEALKNTTGLVKYESTSSDNVGTIVLTFKTGTDINQAKLDVSNKLNEVSSYPQNVEKPVISSSGDNSSPVIWSVLQTKDGNEKHIYKYLTFFNDEIKERIQRVPGVASLFVIGGQEDEVHVKVDVAKLATYHLSIDTVVQVLQHENQNVAAGSMDVDRRTYRIRTTGEFKDLQSIRDVVIQSDGARRIFLKDIATVSFGNEKATGITMFLGVPSIIVGVRAQSDTNIVEMTDEVEKVYKELNAGALSEKNLELKWLYDQRPYIMGSIDLVKQNIFIGAILAIIVLLIFLRSVRATAVVAIAIPISIIATFIILAIMNRSINTISLAGISFAVGMLVDSAIVVLENIDRHKQMGKAFFKAAYDGASEVWGALIASALTTIAVFLPIVFLEDEAGQLFKDIAIAVTGAVSFSLFVSISVIPMLWTLVMARKKDTKISQPQTKSFLVRLGEQFVDLFMFFINKSLTNVFTRLVTVVSLISFAVLSVYIFFPKMEYLPQGNQNLIFNILIPPPGLSLQERTNIGESLFKKMEKHINKEVDGIPPINRLFFGSFGDFMILGGTSAYEERARELIPAFIPVVNSFPGVFGITLQRGVFENGIGEGRSVDIDLSGESIEKLANVGGAYFQALKQALPAVQIRPVPSIELLYQEGRFYPKREALRAVGLDANSLGISLDVLMDGRKIGDFKQDGKKKIDLKLMGLNEDATTPEALEKMLLATPSGGLVPISTLAQLEKTTGISEIRHLGGKRTITLKVTPPESMTIQEMMALIDMQITPAIKKTGLLQEVSVGLSGTADKLKETISAMSLNIILALIITYLLMSALFSNFIYPLIIMVTVPIAAAGGFIGLKLTDTFIAMQPMDVLTMLGFVILIGVVVNNAILIVYQALNNIRIYKLEYKKAVLEATKSRLRPIFMSSLTSIFGMLPLVLFPGPGSEFYRGLGSVITGGLALSTFFTIFMIPSLLLFVVHFEKKGSQKQDGKQVVPEL
ncbi:MAG: efflux RND transporter permease subunit [Sulfurospirillum sp.]|nr:efflux RND transporter permease subunit [Sulfurospirillum sp.]